MSRSTLPAPTDGSWSASPVKIRRVPSLTAFSNPSISIKSIIDASSIMITSCSRGFSSLRPKLSVSSSSDHTNSSRRCMVIAGFPDASSMRLAALPVGAASAVSRPAKSNIFTSVFMIVVLPVPGPPVIIVMLFARQASIALCCSAESSTSPPLSERAFSFAAWMAVPDCIGTGLAAAFLIFVSA